MAEGVPEQVPEYEHYLVLFVFPVEWLVCLFACGAVISHNASKPIVQQNLIDLINSDVARIILTVTTLMIVLGSLEYSLTLWNLKETLAWLHFVASCGFTFMLLNIVIYLCYGVVVRYVYVLSQRIVLEDVADRTMQKAARVISIIISGVFVGVPVALGHVPKFHARFITGRHYNSEAWYPDSVALWVLTATAVLVNVVARLGIWWESKAHLEEQQQDSDQSQPDDKSKSESLRNLLVFTIFLAASVPTAKFLGASINTIRALSGVYVNLAVLLYVWSKPGLRKHARAMLAADCCQGSAATAAVHPS